ncbi:acetate kinase [Niabella ginsenosidivorans]|uniref:Acetate kinase n=1 Tax=Niabella ginsenosidivorans TaxID=1176587 RepID=A0A1A9I168_9BACT|nr:acetate kinase [Niabella ginsenosidivorans]ANH81398.1 acetate kinase [Niabella ginsenosidivorans]
MDILVINAGSSSLKYQLFNMEDGKVLAKGIAERIGVKGGNINHSWMRQGAYLTKTLDIDMPDHHAAFDEISGLLVSKDAGIIQHKDDIDAVGHRVVHGGEHYTQTQKITDAVKKAIEELIPLAPLHNPANLIGINAAEKAFPNAAHIAVFDTAFHHTVPEKAFRYAIPEKYYLQDRIRSYGFHGTSHRYVYGQAVKYLNNKKLKAITIHLGNGASMCAINEKGESVETSMGFGPLAGLIMGTRSGDIDPSVIFHMADELKIPLEDIKNVLNKQSGMLGIGGSNDARDIGRLYEEGNKNALLCYEMYGHRIKKYIGAYTAVLNGADAIIFTAGVGENDALARHYACEGLSALGIVLDEAANVSGNHPEEPVEIQSGSSKVKILVIPTNEELEIALQAYQVMRDRVDKSPG